MASVRRRDQRGDGKIGLIITILIIVAAGYLLMKWVPVRTQNAEFQEFTERAAQRFSIGELNEEKLIVAIMEYAAKEQIPLTEANIDVQANTDRVKIKINYQVEIALVGGKTWVQKYEVGSDTPRF